MSMRHLIGEFSDKRHIVWDWNGTLLDDVEMVIASISVVLEEHSLPALTRERYTELFCFPVEEYYKKLGFDFRKMPFESLSEKFVEQYMTRILSCRLHEGVKDLLSDLKASGVSQSVLSAAHESSLHKHLSHFGIHEFFDRIYGLDDHHAKGKVERGRDLLRDSGLAPEHTLLVGDTDHDLEVGRELGIDVLLLGDGHQSYERLSKIHHRVIRNRYSPAG